ncbi:hypothetical protein [Pseudooceanicola nitratireducens]|uniref:hypothetical protein n=1 Tax=Pseudooceanicola nitratireducens TaxID=517719 RepID=UPI001C948F8C|nr:hypothetical protein [Pseudooceanicola nitratireducens]MBY6158051.1 hypothetical protein [Pseudooceanicola nitratireducens]
MFYLDKMTEDKSGFNALSSSADWTRWLVDTIPNGWDQDVERRLVSNLKHTLVGLEMKAGLIQPQEDTRDTNASSVLFEPYFQVMTHEFCVGTVSVCEGLGSAIHLSTTGGDPTCRVMVKDWQDALVKYFDPTGKDGLAGNIARVKSIRDKMHQDTLGAREDIDWHEFGYEPAFIPAKQTLECLLKTNAASVPPKSNLQRR